MFDNARQRCDTHNVRSLHTMYIAPSCRVVSRMLRLVHSIWTELNFSSRTHCEQPHWKCTCPELATVEQYEVYRVGQKVGPQTHDQHSLKWILKIPPHLACVATLPCETLMSAKQANDKLQGSVATMYMSLLVIKLRNVYLWVKKKLKSVNFWESYKQERGCLMHFVRLVNTLLKEEVHTKRQSRSCL